MASDIKRSDGHALDLVERILVDYFQRKRALPSECLLHARWKKYLWDDLRGLRLREELGSESGEHASKQP